MVLDRKHQLKSEIKYLENEKAKITKKKLKVFPVLKLVTLLCWFKSFQAFNCKCIAVLLSLL